MNRPPLDPRTKDSSLLVRAAMLLTTVGAAAVVVDRLIDKAFRYARLAIEDERQFGGSKPGG